MNRFVVILLVLSFCAGSGRAQTDSIPAYRFNVRQLVLPTAMIGVGTIGLTSGWAKRQNRNIRDGLRDENTKKIRIDDFSLYVPMASVYGLNLCGLKGEHSMRDYTLILASSYVMMEAAVSILKLSINEQRPDGSTYDSFPSGHTAAAFMGAELLRHEYRDVSPWIGVGGYVIATGTGFLRMYNNRHWLNDVIAGAGIGILSAKASYWLFPYLSKKIFKKKRVQTELAFY
jgi:membrane-associated phospholipid phosphatase